MPDDASRNGVRLDDEIIYRRLVAALERDCAACPHRCPHVDIVQTQPEDLPDRCALKPLVRARVRIEADLDLHRRGGDGRIASIRR